MTPDQIREYRSKLKQKALEHCTVDGLLALMEIAASRRQKWLNDLGEERDEVKAAELRGRASELKSFWCILKDKLEEEINPPE